MNTTLVKQRLKKKNLTQGELGKLLGVRQSTMSQKINNTRPTTLLEAEMLADILDIPDSELRAYFFASP